MSPVHYELILEGEPFYLLPQKAAYRPQHEQLILSDLHLGKTSHFRRQGIAMPQQSKLRDMDLLNYLLTTWNPKTVLILGDLFHSDYNREWLWFKSLLQQHAQKEFILVEGNHDILDEQNYRIDNLVKTELLEEPQFIFSHQPLRDPAKLNFCGHLHPGLRIYGAARQTEKLPCFYFNYPHFILPAFGSLTGLYMIEKNEQATCFLIAENRVIAY